MLLLSITFYLFFLFTTTLYSETTKLWIPEPQLYQKQWESFKSTLKKSPQPNSITLFSLACGNENEMIGSVKGLREQLV